MLFCYITPRKTFSVCAIFRTTIYRTFALKFIARRLSIAICANDEAVTCATNADCVTAGVGGQCGFAGKRDWRVPNIKELQSIINYENFFLRGVGGAAVSVAFNRRCVPGATVLTGSCTVTPPDPDPNLVGADYWSSTSLASDPERAWGTGFDDGSVPDDLKSATFHVRAVR